MVSAVRADATEVSMSKHKYSSTNGLPATAGVGKLFMVEGRMGLWRASRGPDRYKSHKSTQWMGVCMLAYMLEYDCYVTWSWVSGDPLATWRRLMSHAAVGAAAAHMHSHWLCVCVCVWNARPWSTPQVTERCRCARHRLPLPLPVVVSAWKQSLIFRRAWRAAHNVTTDRPPRAGSTELAGRIWPAGRTLPTPALQGGEVHPNFENQKNVFGKNFLAPTTTRKIRWIHWLNLFLNPFTITGDICNFVTAVSALSSTSQRSAYN